MRRKPHNREGTDAGRALADTGARLGVEALRPFRYQNANPVALTCMTTSLTASGKVLVVSLMGALILLVGFGLYLLIRSARRTLRAGGSVRDAPAWFGGPTYRELKPGDTAAMVGLRIWRAFGLVLLAVGAGFTIFAVLTSGSKPQTQLLSAPVGHRLVFPDVRLPRSTPSGTLLQRFWACRLA